jgi:hypothetical protein
MPYVLVGDVGFCQRAEIKDALARLQHAAVRARPESYGGDPRRSRLSRRLAPESRLDRQVAPEGLHGRTQPP